MDTEEPTTPPLGPPQGGDAQASPNGTVCQATRLALPSEHFSLTHTRARGVSLLSETPVPDDGPLTFHLNGAANEPAIATVESR